MDNWIAKWPSTDGWHSDSSAQEDRSKSTEESPDKKGSTIFTCHQL